eukprot:NODE_2700_length_1008_cov_139.692395_g2680_i0.p1 GENE.NODE_2700_length_1008_cov_139.692395_g2680_i0~~NODE_2700_length_1008_cov_139.692395_g2680_i0.p1  ORF type:complete len:277 (-),score=4.15 NODE_2700_length_1008_cov_139.692395_g2680_i0:91-921(-)
MSGPSVGIPFQSPLRTTIGVCQTPSGKSKDVYKYYCPICMWHFRKCWKTVCCAGQYICEFCLESYVEDNVQSLPQNRREADPVKLKASCPFCNKGLAIVPARDAVPRCYMDSPDTRFKLERSQTQVTNPTRSPPKVGDTFDDLRRKVVAFNGPSTGGGGTSAPPSVSSISSTPGRLNAHTTPPLARDYSRRRSEAEESTSSQNSNHPPPPVPELRLPTAASRPPPAPTRPARSPRNPVVQSVEPSSMCCMMTKSQDSADSSNTPTPRTSSRTCVIM